MAVAQVPLPKTQGPYVGPLEAPASQLLDLSEANADRANAEAGVTPTSK